MNSNLERNLLELESAAFDIVDQDNNALAAARDAIVAADYGTVHYEGFIFLVSSGLRS